MSAREGLDRSSAPLLASAFVIVAMIVLAAGRLPEPAAFAESTAVEGDYTVMTARSGRGGETEPDELLLVIDNRTETLLIYEVEDAARESLVLRDGGSLQVLFNRARP